MARRPDRRARLAELSGQAAQPVNRAIADLGPEAVVTALFGVAALDRADAALPMHVHLG